MKYFVSEMTFTGLARGLMCLLVYALDPTRFLNTSACTRNVNHLTSNVICHIRSYLTLTAHNPNINIISAKQHSYVSYPIIIQIILLLH